VDVLAIEQPEQPRRTLGSWKIGSFRLNAIWFGTCGSRMYIFCFWIQPFWILSNSVSSTQRCAFVTR